MSHGQPDGVIVWALACSTWAAMILLAFALGRLRQRSHRRPPAPPVVTVTAHPRQDARPYELPAWTAGPDREEPS